MESCTPRSSTPRKLKTASWSCWSRNSNSASKQAFKPRLVISSHGERERPNLAGAEPVHRDVPSCETEMGRFGKKKNQSLASGIKSCPLAERLRKRGPSRVLVGNAYLRAARAEDITPGAESLSRDWGHSDGRSARHQGSCSQHDAQGFRVENRG